MEINLQHESVVNERTGEVAAPSEYMENLRALERSIQRYDDDIGSLRESLKELKAAREKAVTALREGIREGNVLPLLEVEDESSHPEDEA